MSAVAGSYSRSVVSPRDENVRILAFISSLLWNGAIEDGLARRPEDEDEE
jgi:hypothetical protein